MVATSDEWGEPYYYHLVTGETTWERPEEGRPLPPLFSPAEDGGTVTVTRVLDPP